MVRVFFGAMGALLGALLVLAPSLFAPVCETAANGARMNCWYSGAFVAGSGAAILFLELGSLSRCLGKLRVLAAFVVIAAASACMLVPTGVISVAGDGWACGLCGDPAHACRAVTMPFVRWVCSLIIVLNCFSLLWDFVGGER